MKRRVAFFFVLALTMMFSLSFFDSNSFAKPHKVKLSKKTVYSVYNGGKLDMVSTKGLSRDTMVNWTVEDSSIACIVTGSLGGGNLYYTSLSLPAYQTCYINPKLPGTTRLIAKADGHKKAICKIIVAEKGDAIGYYVETSRNRFGIDDEEKQAADLIRSVIPQIVTEDMSRVERIRAVNDYISQITTYDMENFKAKIYVPSNATVSGPMLYHKAVCAGYAVTFDTFMYALGIPCRYIYGTSLPQKEGDEGGAHGWNLVQMDDDAWYHIDVTWNDDDLDSYNNNGVCYKYFLLTDSAICSTRTWDASLFPACVGTEYSDYRSVLNKEAVVRNLPGYVVFDSKQEAMDYLIMQGKAGVEHVPIAYRGDSWISESERNYIKDAVDRKIWFWWDSSGVCMGEYRWYNYTLYY